MKSLELANDIYLSGEVLYSYPNWLKTMATREEFYKNPHEGSNNKKIRDKERESTDKIIRKIREENISKAETDEESEDVLLYRKKEGDTSALNIFNRSVAGSLARCYPWAKKYWTGSTGGMYGGYDKDIYIEGINGDKGMELRGFAKFDISSIPDSSIVNDIELHVFCYRDAGMPNVAIRKLNSDPVLASWETIFEEAGDGTLYVSNWLFSDGYFDMGQWEVKSLGQMAAIDLQAALGQDWFALGFEQDDFSTSSYAWCYGWDSFFYKPYIVVDYDPLPCKDDDPLFPIQWHLENTGQCGIAGEDVNISPVWSMYQGSSSVIAIVDSGLEIAHEDLIDNVLPDLCWDYVDKDKDPTSTNPHGTACAGIAAARGWNCLGGRGAAPLSKIVGHRLIGAETEDNIADALTRNFDIIDIYSCSCGPSDTGKNLDGPDPSTEEALAYGVSNGRDALGNVYVWAGGNGNENKDNSNYDGYANSRYTIAIAASDDSGKHSYYSEKGANIVVNAPSSGGDCSVTTCDITGPDGYNPGNYTSKFGGTSAAAPLVSGVIALMLDANPNLSWRDVQHILIKTAEQNDPYDADWEINGVGYHVNHKYGFGRVDAEEAITTSLSWKSVGPEVSIEGSSWPNIVIPDYSYTGNNTGVADSILIDENIKIEFIEVYFNAADHCNWGNLEIELISPMGTSSILAEKHSSDNTTRYDNWRFGTVRHFGEDSIGTWTLLVKDLAYTDIGTFQSWTLKIYGHEDPNKNHPPAISGTAQTNTPINEQYSFFPIASDPDGGPLYFNIVNKPIWASFNSNTGALTGTPSCDDSGITKNIQITVSDGEFSASLEPFNLTVKDDYPPQIICPSDITVKNDPGKFTAHIDLDWPIVFDNCDTNVTNNAPSPTVFPLGSTPVKWTARDPLGNEAACTQIITVEKRIIEAGPIGYDYWSIQKAIDDACDGDTIIVHDGTYIENNILIDKNLVVKSKNGAMHTIIEGNPDSPVISFLSIDDPNARFSGFTITNGKNHGYGGGIYCKDSNLIISNNIISNNSAEYGGGICCIHSSPTIINNTLVNNSGMLDGAGIYADKNSFPVIMNSILWNDEDNNELYGIDIDRISYCDIRDEEFLGQNNIFQNPMFVNPDEGNYHLKKESPCRDTGNPDGSYYDLDGSRNDMGADGGPWGVKDTNTPIIKEIIITPPNGKTGEEISFAAEADDEWGIAAYSWDFDDSDGIQEDALGEKVFHTFEYEGNYIVTLTVEDNSGLKHMDTREIIISVDEPPAPPKILSISTSPSTPCGNVPLDVLVNIDAVDTDGYIVSYELYLSDSNEIIADSRDPHLNFTIDRKIIKPEAFEISVSVTDNDGMKDYDSIPITLLPIGDHIEASGMIGIEGGKIDVSDSASNLFGVKASIPKNALSDDYVITISTIKACPPFPDQCIGIGVPVDFGPSIKFNSSVTITIPYDSNELEANGISPGDNLKIYFYDILQSNWRSIENSKIDSENECVSARISHFTLFKIGYDTGVISPEENGCFINTLFTNIRLKK
jgi:subtilisin-like proprotein convertase family protein